ncbi:MAG TPA: T9SS type A sorting domain-containing protein [Flavobacteriales bacterium]
MKRFLPLLFVSLGTAAFAQVQNYSEGDVVDDFTVTDTEGNVHNLYAITASGKHVMLDFFFDTCPPCQATQPYFNQLHETYGCNSADLFVISINNGTDNNAAVIAFEATYGGSYTHSPAVGIEGGCSAVDEAFGIMAYPTYCLIGPDNQLKSGDIWPISNMSSYVAAFPTGSDIQPAACAAVGVHELGANGAFSVYPTPSTGLVTVVRNGTSSNGYELFDVLGQSVRHFAASSAAQRTLDLSDLPNGQYLLRSISPNNKNEVRRITIAH